MTLHSMDDSLCSLFSTDEVPTDFEASKLRELCYEHEERLTSLELEIKRLKDLLCVRDDERSQLRKFLNVHKAPLSLLRRMPPEILQSIFLHCLPTTRNSVMHYSENPILLGRICRRWRAIAYGTPELWSSVHVVIPSRDKDEEATGYELALLKGLEAWLSRSGICPLNISVHCSHRSDLSSCLTVLAKFSRRWQRVEFLNAPSYWKNLPGFSAVKSGDLPLLETFIVRASSPKFGWYRPANFPSGVFQALEDAPSLRRVVVTDSSSMLLPNFAWGHLHDLHLVSSGSLGLALERGTISELLAQCTNLRTCTIQCSTWQGIHTNPTLSITLPFLRNFSLVVKVAGNQLTTLSEVLDRLTAPKLEKLEIRGLGERDELPALSRFLKRSSCSLRKLTLALGDFTKEDFVELLPFIDHVTDFNFQNWATGFRNDDGVDMNDWVLAVLTPGSTEAQEVLHSRQSQYTAFCPKLASFTLSEPADVLSNALLQFLHSRASPLAVNTGVATLQSAKCSFRTVIPEHLQWDIESLMKSGLKLEIGAPKPMVTFQRRINPWEGLPVYEDETE